MLEIPTRFALIIGAMKAGTTSLYSYLASHPQIASSRLKEPFPFAREDYPRDLETYARLWEWDPSTHKVALEASTDYTKLPVVADVPERVAALGTERFKLLYVVRAPLRRIESQVRHSLATHQEICGKVEPQRDFSLAQGVSANHIAFSSYAMQLDAWMHWFSRDQLHIVVLEQLQAEPHAVLKGICEFVGIDSDWQFEDAGRVYGRSPRTIKELRPLWLKLSSVRPLRRLIATLLPARARAAMRDRLGTRYARHRLNARETAYALEALRDDIRRLTEEYGVETERWWGRGGQTGLLRTGR